MFSSHFASNAILTKLQNVASFLFAHFLQKKKKNSSQIQSLRYYFIPRRAESLKNIDRYAMNRVFTLNYLRLT